MVAGFVVLLIAVLGLFIGIALVVAGIVMRKRVEKNVVVTVILIAAGTLIIVPCLAILAFAVIAFMAASSPAI